MKYIVIGLGYFGSNLASKLTSMGHEVIGVDNHPERLDELKESVTTVMKMDATNINAVRSLPLEEADAVIVAIGEDVGSSILAASILKNLKVKRIIGRAIHQTHHSILNQIGIDEVVMPLEDSAAHVASMLQIRNTQRVIELNEEYAVAEIPVPGKYIGHAPETISIDERFHLNLIAVKSPPKESVLKSLFKRDYRVNMALDPFAPLGEKEILVVAGRILDIKRFIGS
jgi:trk system potassium uptake protein TrkA